MPEDTSSSDSLQLPDDPDLHWLRKQAKRRLREIQATSPDAQLADAQFQLARQYGFPSWRALKSHVDALAIDALVSSALEQAEHSPPAVKAAALLGVARVVNVRSRDEARRVLERGIATAQALREPAKLILLGEAFTVAAKISPDNAFGLLHEIADDFNRHRLEIGLYMMAEHGHHEAAVGYLLSAPPDASFPFDATDRTMSVAPDDQTRAALLRRAIRAARSSIGSGHHVLSEFLQLFNGHWRVLPAEEAGAVVREMVAAIVAGPDERGSFTRQGVRFSSARQHLLFVLLGPCRHLEPGLANSLVADHSQLAKAAARFPRGLESIDESVRPPSMETAPRESEPVADELRTNFDRAFQLARSAYAIDSDPRRPNRAPQQCWPSAHGFRSILYKSGCYEGRAALRHLERVPDPALRLFALIELAAALVGVRQMGGAIMADAPEIPEHPRRRAHHDDSLDVPPGLVMPPPFAGKPDVPPSYDVRIAPSRHGRGTLPTGGCDADFWVLEAARLRPVLAELFEASPSRIVLPLALDDSRFDFTLVLPNEVTREVLLATMRNGVERHFNVRRELRAVDVQALTAPRGIRAHEWPSEDIGGIGGGIAGGSFDFFEPSSTASPPDFEEMMISSLMDLSIVPSSSRRIDDEMRESKRRFLRMLGGSGVLSGIHQLLTMSELCLALEAALDRIFVDETGSIATYRIDIRAEVSDSQAFLDVLCGEFGLAVTPGRREIEMLVVE